jgi:SAM-dependent methyltransferase
MDAQSYDQWYQTPRGRWIGQVEADMIHSALAPRAGESLLDVGCGTGFFTRALGRFISGSIVGVDNDADRAAFARTHDPGRATYAVADACALPYADAAFDLVISIAAICFAGDESAALREIVRVARRRVAIGLLNRTSVLWWAKGRGGGTGAYRGARWHTVGDARSRLAGLPVRDVRVWTGIHLPRGGAIARSVEHILPRWLPTGGFMLVVGDKTSQDYSELRASPLSISD